MSEHRATEEVISSPQAEYDTLRHVSAESACPYLPDRSSRNEAFYFEELDGATYERLLRLGFRRCGRVVYRPRCRTCDACRQLRIPVMDFRPTSSLARVARRNSDVRVEMDTPSPSEQKFELYRSYLDSQHDGAMDRTYEAFHEFLYDSPTETREFRYLLGRRLVGVSIVDRLPRGLSSVYMYFDPTFRSRSLGTFSVLWEIDLCRREGLSHYYLGYYVAGTNTMSYKSRFRPNEVLVGDDRWVRFRES